MLRRLFRLPRGVQFAFAVTVTVAVTFTVVLRRLFCLPRGVQFTLLSLLLLLLLLLLCFAWSAFLSIPEGPFITMSILFATPLVLLFSSQTSRRSHASTLILVIPTAALSRRCGYHKSSPTPFVLPPLWRISILSFLHFAVTGIVFKTPHRNPKSESPGRNFVIPAAQVISKRLPPGA